MSSPSSSTREPLIALRGVTKTYTIWDDPAARLMAPLRRLWSAAGPKTDGRHFTAVKDITLEVARGECLGIIGRKAIHMMKPEERDGAKKFDLADLHVDIGAKTKKDALKQVQIGDPVTFQLGMSELGDDLITAPALDDRRVPIAIPQIDFELWLLRGL